MAGARNLGTVLRQLPRCVRDRDGNAAVEFAFVMPALFFFLVGSMYLGMTLWRQNALDYAVSKAARFAEVLCAQPATCSAQVKTYAASISGGNFDSSVFTYTYTPPATPPTSPCGYLVTASYPMSVPYLNLSMTLTSQACWPN
jgi:Flp pilus assembly protein TadG